MKKILATMMALALAIGAQAQNDSILIRGDVRDNFTNAEITSGRAFFNPIRSLEIYSIPFSNEPIWV